MLNTNHGYGCIDPISSVPLFYQFTHLHWMPFALMYCRYLPPSVRLSCSSAVACAYPSVWVNFAARWYGKYLKIFPKIYLSSGCSIWGKGRVLWNTHHICILDESFCLNKYVGLECRPSAFRGKMRICLVHWSFTILFTDGGTRPHFYRFNPSFLLF